MQHPAKGGPQLRIENSIKALSKLCDLDIINTDRNTSKETSTFFKEYSCLNEYHEYSFSSKFDSNFNPFSFSEKIINKIFNTRRSQLVKFIIRHIDRREISILWFGFGNISYGLIRQIKKKGQT